MNLRQTKVLQGSQLCSVKGKPERIIPVLRGLLLILMLGEVLGPEGNHCHDKIQMRRL